MLDLNEINRLLENKNISAISFRSNGPACEEYICVKFDFSNEDSVTTMIPYVYRRSNMNLSSEQEIADYLTNIKQFFSKDNREKWATNELNKISFSKKISEKFLAVLLKNVCNEVLQNQFPENNNRQKVLQKIKNDGYVIPILRGTRDNGNMTRYWLLPLPLIQSIHNETIPSALKKRILTLLENKDAYEDKISYAKHLLPDHKFSEIRWTPETAEINRAEMTEEEIRSKFQLLTTQRNEQKREVCKNCKKTGKRGTIFGIKFFYKGTEKWDTSIPEIGKEAEKGCVGCPWYDIQKWREEVQKKLNNSQNN